MDRSAPHSGPIGPSRHARVQWRKMTRWAVGGAVEGGTRIKWGRDPVRRGGRADALCPEGQPGTRTRRATGCPRRTAPSLWRCASPGVSPAPLHLSSVRAREERTLLSASLNVPYGAGSRLSGFSLRPTKIAAPNRSRDHPRSGPGSDSIDLNAINVRDSSLLAADCLGHF